jgi:hypothetical protein
LGKLLEASVSIGDTPAAQDADPHRAIKVYFPARLAGISFGQ